MWDNLILNGNVFLNSGILVVTIRLIDGIFFMWLEKIFLIIIQNVNDFFEQVNLFNFVVYENVILGIVIGELIVVDGDDSLNIYSYLNFKWVLIYDGDGKFGINVNKIVVVQSLVFGLFKIIVDCLDFGILMKLII